MDRFGYGCDHLAAKYTDEDVGKGTLGEANGYKACAGRSLPVVLSEDGPSLAEWTALGWVMIDGDW